MSLAAKLPYDHPYAGGFSGIGSQPLPTDADALDYLSRMATADGAGVETGVAVAVDAFFRDSKAAGVFDALKACCILAGARTLAGALVPVVGDAPTNVANGFVNGDFSRTSGLTGDGTSYIDSGRAADDDGQNDVHLSRYITAAGTAALFEIHIGARGPSGNLATTQIGYSAGGAFNFLAARNESQRVDVAGSQFTGFAGVTRSVSTSMTARINGSTSSAASTSGSPPSIPYYVFARNNNGSADGLSNATIAFYSIGTDIGSAGLTALDTAVTHLINRLKFALLVGENPSGLDPDTIDYIVRGYEAGGSLE